MSVARNLREDRAGLLLATAGAAAALFIVLTSAAVVCNAWVPVPFQDQWDHWRLCAAHDHYGAFLFAQHNEHRIALPRLFFLADHRWFGGRNAFLLVSNFLLLGIAAFWLWRLGARAGKWSPASRLLLGCAMFAGMFSAQQFTNLTWGFQVQFILVNLAAVGAVFAVVRLAERRAAGAVGEWWLAGACLCATAATWSLSSGLLAWPVVVALAFTLRLPFRDRTALAAGTAAMAALYLWGYTTPPHHAHPLDSLLHRFPATVAFALAYLGSPSDALVYAFARVWGFRPDGHLVPAAVVAGAAGIVAFAAGWLAVWRRGMRRDAAQAGLLHVALFILLSAAVTALGRVNFPLDVALSSRYRTPVLIFWLSLAAFYWSWSETRLLAAAQRLRRPVQAGVVLSILALFGGRQLHFVEASRGYGGALRDAQAAIAAGVYDRAVWLRVFHTPQDLGDAIGYLRRNRLSVFAEEWTRWPGQPAAGRFVFDHRNGCDGRFGRAVPAGDGWRVTGWASDGRAQGGPRTIVFLDGGGVVAGVAAGTSHPQSRRAPWSGYLAVTDPHAVTAYLLKEDRRTLCRLGTLPRR